MDLLCEEKGAVVLEGVEDFPWTVIESPKSSMMQQNKLDMHMTSKEQGGVHYEGPTILWLPRWNHTAKFYVMEPSPAGIYLAQSLHDRFHYQVPKKDSHIIDAMKRFCKKQRGTTFRLISASENYQDDNLLVINHPSPRVQSYLSTINDDDIIMELINNSEMDLTRGNCKIDTGFASAKSQKRSRDAACVSQPTLLLRSKEDVFIRTMVDVSTVMDMICEEYHLPQYFRVDAIDSDWSRTLHPNNLCQQVRNSIALSHAAFGGHLDTMNDPREGMCPVPVIHQIVQTPLGLARHAKIGCTRRACFEAGVRRDLLQPIVEEVSTWYMNQPETRRKVTNRLFSFPQQDDVYDSQIFPMHFEKSVGLSPFIDGVIKLQRRFSLQQEHCISIAYHTVTNESPFYFYRTVFGIG